MTGRETPSEAIEFVLRSYRHLITISTFEINTKVRCRLHGLAILSSPDKFQVFVLQRTVSKLLVVFYSFRVKPLLRLLQSADHYHCFA